MAGARRHKQALAVAIVLLVVAAADLTAVLLWQPTSRSVLHDALVVLWPLPALAGFLLGAYELFLHKRLVAEIGRISGPGIVEHLLPSEVLRTFLSSVYGPNAANDDVVAGVLGGDGMRPRGDDLTISTSTTVKLELQGIDTKTYHFMTTQRYQFRNIVPVDRFVIFATSNALLRDTIPAACRYPLFESYFIPDPSLFLDSVDDLRHSTQIAIDYIDHEGQRRSAEPSQIPPVEVRFDQWANYLTFFRESMGPMRKLSPLDHMSDLRIFECDLSGIADDHVVRAICGLTVWSRTLQRTNDGFCYWQSPYPSFVDKITFDATGLAVDHSPRHEFRVMPFTFRSATTSAQWLEAGELGDLDVRSWLLPGHGVALLWREALG
ncbi:hypothetical protein [Lentzea flava]|uniref:Uncharacterized protein n=1 Tax=Lentzea flava TaxID=103732 RepID=A0ABQ2UDW4_9PSEU|nr:hypothetical protein [Lentzea flava]MCP2198407.1 hypothetical protein [Lentzea flava]GGU25680.1 hypothetical protein GCM10010178_17330 [Lentzea flava]